MTVRLASVLTGGVVEPWEALGFAVERDGAGDGDGGGGGAGGGRLAFANGAVRVTGSGEGGLLGLELDADESFPSDIEGVPLAAGSVVAGVDHPNGAFEIDHVVFRTHDLEASSEAISAALGLELRRIRETDTVRQGFHRFPDQGGVRGCIVEIVEDQRATAASLWGLVVNVVDLDAAVERLGADLIGPAKPAVQAGRRIATVRRGAGIGVPLALMTPA